MTIVKRVSVPEAPPSRPRIPRRVFFCLVGCMVCLFCLFSLFLSFRIFHVRTGLAASIARVVPYPAAVVDGRIIWYANVVRLSEFLDANPVQGTDSFEASLNVLTRRAVVEQYARQFDLSVSKEDRDLARAAGLAPSPLADWSEGTYEKYVLDPLLLSQKVEQAVKADKEAQGIAKMRLQKIQLDLQAGMDFEGIAQYRSEDPAAAFGGSLGWFDRAHIPVGLESAFDLPVGSVSGILEQEDFFSLVKVRNQELNGAGERERVSLMIISVHKAILSQVVDAYLSDHPVTYFVD